MTDNEIISIDEAIRHCYETYYERDDLCREFREEHKQLAKWLEELKENRNTINCQQAEIEQWKDEANRWQSAWCEAVDDIEKSKSKAIKEFAERLRKKCHNYYPSMDSYCVSRYAVEIADVDGLVREMTEVEE